MIFYKRWGNFLKKIKKISMDILFEKIEENKEVFIRLCDKMRIRGDIEMTNYVRKME